MQLGTCQRAITACVKPCVKRYKNLARTFPTGTRAREERADLLAKEILEIADAPCKDAVEVAHARNRLDTRKWLASKLAPRKYGDRVEHDHKGGLNFQPAVLVQISGNERVERYSVKLVENGKY